MLADACHRSISEHFPHLRKPKCSCASGAHQRIAPCTAAAIRNRARARPSVQLCDVRAANHPACMACGQQQDRGRTPTKSKVLSLGAGLPRLGCRVLPLLSAPGREDAGWLNWGPSPPGTPAWDSMGSSALWVSTAACQQRNGMSAQRSKLCLGCAAADM